MIQPNTIITGDSLTVLRSMDDESVDMVITDPPYGIDYTGVLNYDEETGLIYDEDGDVVDEKTLDAMLDGDGKGDDEDE